ncbi:MAG TPA: hypothetical protein VM253_02960 [Candidatus Limnocylindrales bacterium]|jgi:uncharacterized membrane protein YuzA (DUF378 family)|nr:hypothetical protein [Candidatus Limnocylindrales bacterium]
MNRMNFAPRLPTIIVALAFTLIGLLGTFGNVLPAVAGIESTVLGVWAYLVGFAVLIAGIVLRGL